MRKRKKVNILFLKGIKEEDFKTIEDIFERKIQEKMNSDFETPMVSNFDIIPKKFYPDTWRKTWIKTTNLKCWNCTRNFNTVPLFIPVCTLIDENYNEYYEVKGNFCVINCAYSFARKEYNDNNLVDIHARLLLLYEKIYGKRILRIPICPDKEDMLEYGGKYTHEEYGKEIDRRNKDQSLIKYKLEHFKINYEDEEN